jgi:hypothetical protein
MMKIDSTEASVEASVELQVGFAKEVDDGMAWP